ncbi:MAG TPA: hypothetical protein PKD79_00500 [Candidatus Doudnabacteria bacterium]|nr:hypothetical protein [Candidatus Doudnabacteria bacterium]
MNKQLLAIVGIIVVVAAGLLVWKGQNDSGDRVSGERITGNNSLSALLALNQNLVCTFEHEDEFGEQSGTVYIAGEKMNGEFQITDSEGTSKAYLIRDDEYQYLWGDEFEQGIKFRLSALTEFKATESEHQENIDLDEEYNVDCGSWRVDNSKFVPPSSVEFADFTAQAQAAAEVMQSIPQDMPQVDASICDQIPAGPARDQCIANFNQ